VPNGNNGISTNGTLININVQGFNTSQDKLSIPTLSNDSSNAYTNTVVADPLASNQIKVDLLKLTFNDSAGSSIPTKITESKISSVVLNVDTSLTSSKSSLDNILVENDLGVPVNSTIYGNQANASTPEIFAGSVLKDTIVYGGSGTDIFTYITPGDIFLGGSGTNDSLVLKGLRSSYTLEYVKDLPDTDNYSNFKDATNIKDTFFSSFVNSIQ